MAEAPAEWGGWRLAVIGAGQAGRRFAAECAAAGLAVTLEDVMPANLRRAEEELAALGQCVELVTTVEDAVHAADIAVDFVPDELESKLEILSLMDRMAPPRTVLLTPSATLSITDLSSCTYRADRCAMLRGLGGIRVRVLRAEATSETTCAMVLALLGALGFAAAVEADPDLRLLRRSMGYACKE